MMNSQTYNIEQIKHLRETEPARYSKLIAKDSNFVKWLSDQLNFTTDSIPEMVYAVLNPNESAHCGSGNRRKFRNINIGWMRCGNKTCQPCKEYSQEKTKSTNIEKYGVDNPMKNDSVKETLKSTNLKKYGVEWSQSNPAIRNKTKETYLKTHGVDHYWKTPEGQVKRKATIKEKYGVENPSQNRSLQVKKKQTFIENYGVEHPMKNAEMVEKVRTTTRERHGVDNVSELPEIRDKAKQTILERYGVEHACQSEVFKEKSRNTTMERYGHTSVMKIDSYKQKVVETKRDTFYENLNERVQGMVVPLFSREEYTLVSKLYNWECTACTAHFKDDLDDGYIPQCPVCFPKSKSKGEDAVHEFIAENYTGTVIRNSRSIIKPLELDIYLPELNLAVEYNGIYRHSENSSDVAPTYHLNKTSMCEELGIKLIHIFDQEWLNQEHIVKSRLLSYLKQNIRIFARKCQLIKLDSKTKTQFLNDNHIQGDCQSSVNYGLDYNGQLIAVMTFGKARYNKKAQWEMLRYASLINCNVVGGAGKLMNHFEKEYDFPSVVSYCDRRWGNGEVYLNIGFKYQYSSSPNYWYWNRPEKLESRIKYQKHKLKHFKSYDETLTEWEIMKLEGFDRIWDCGNHVFIKNHVDRS